MSIVHRKLHLEDRTDVAASQPPPRCESRCDSTHSMKKHVGTSTSHLPDDRKGNRVARTRSSADHRDHTDETLARPRRRTFQACRLLKPARLGASSSQHLHPSCTQRTSDATHHDLSVGGWRIMPLTRRLRSAHTRKALFQTFSLSLLPSLAPAGSGRSSRCQPSKSHASCDRPRGIVSICIHVCTIPKL